MDVTKIESKTLDLDKEIFYLKDMVADIVDIYREGLNQKNIEIKHCISDEDFLYADKDRVSQVVSNLISNSIKFIVDKRNGIISITAEKNEIKIDIGNDDNKFIVISVKDNGTGIDENIMPILFSKFQTKSFHGMGLGLYICKSIIESHGGTIWAKNNEDGSGATFSFSLPIIINNCC